MKIRKNVAAVILNKKGLVLVGERRDLPGQWQLPQGGIDNGETPEEAVLREVTEETCIDRDFLLIVNVSKPLVYVLPENIAKKSGFDGQEQLYFLLKFNGAEKIPAPSKEFSSFEWCEKKEVINRVVHFKKKCYTDAFEQLFGETEK
ncbi:MAG TPA: NUDIX domain-containing protein [bacterium]|nr:NUDIX domain-containing protein [bacterium]